jgi:hypothetical protein
MRARMDSVQSKTAPLWLLLRVNALQSWRRLLAVRETIAAADRRHRLVHRRLSRRVVRAVLSRAEIHREISGPGRGADGTAAVRLFAFLFALLLLSNLVIATRICSATGRRRFC